MGLPRAIAWWKGITSALIKALGDKRLWHGSDASDIRDGDKIAVTGGTDRQTDWEMSPVVSTARQNTRERWLDYNNDKTQHCRVDGCAWHVWVGCEGMEGRLGEGRGGEGKGGEGSGTCHRSLHSYANALPWRLYNENDETATDDDDDDDNNNNNNNNNNNYTLI